MQERRTTRASVIPAEQQSWRESKILDYLSRVNLRMRECSTSDPDSLSVKVFLFKASILQRKFRGPCKVLLNRELLFALIRSGSAHRRFAVSNYCSFVPQSHL